MIPGFLHINITKNEVWFYLDEKDNAPVFVAQLTNPTVGQSLAVRLKKKVRLQIREPLGPKINPPKVKKPNGSPKPRFQMRTFKGAKGLHKQS